MTDTKPLVRRAGLDALYFSGANHLLRPLAQGVGVILMLHRVRPRRSDAFQPNKFLEVTPEYLEQAIKWLARNSYQFVSLDEARERLVERRFDVRFVSITFDDGFRDNKVWAQPILSKYKVPYTIFIPTDFAEGAGNLWWLALESIVASQDRIVLDDRSITCKTTREKIGAYHALKAMVLSRLSHSEEEAFIGQLARRHDYDQHAATRAACMNWDEIRALSADPLMTIGAHTVSHPILAKASDVAVRAELTECRDILEQKLQKNVRHLAYPFGSADAVGAREFRIASEVGYQTAVTTRTGVVMPADVGRLLQLPRITIDGTFQRERYLETLVSGVAPAVWNGLRRASQLGARRPTWA
jgi:peptidoglycan/xylan/chitin deacetylase (PgdA/CDA1 family)